MARVHQLLVLTFVSGSALYSGLVPALGLGDINLQSALNQPLSAEIELLDVGDLTRDEIKVRLASQSAFDQSGVDRPFFLNDLRFTPVMRGKSSVVRVVSTQPVREPYLNFIVEMARPGGTLLREYTLLLDPPDSPYLASAAPAPAARTDAAPSRAPRAAAAPAVRSAPPAARAPSGPLPAAVQGKHYRVASGDSLWAIARRFNPGNEASLEGLMRDIQLLNPQAFVGGEAHRLKVGAELLLPDTVADEAPPAMLSLSSEDEELENTRPTAPAPSVPGSPESQAALQRRVDEELASRADESQSLQQQMRDLQNQLQILQQQLSEKDQQLASLESRLAASPAAVPQAAAPVAVEPAPPAEASADRAAPGQPETPPADAVAPLDEPAPATTPQAESAPLPPTDAAQVAPAQTAPAAAAEPAPAAPVAEEPAAEAEQSGGSSIWLIGAFCLVMLLALLLLLRRRRKPARLPDPEVVVVPVVEDDALVSPARVRSAASVEPPVEARTAVSTDPLEAANIYIAYGRFGEAESTLRHALENAPARMDLRLRLLEVLAEIGDLGGFAREEAVLREMGASPAQLERIKTRYPAMNADADLVPMADSRVDPLQDAVLDLDDLPPAAVAHAAPDDSANDYPLNLDDLSLDADWDLINPFPNQSSKGGQGKTEVEEEPDFHSNLQELPEVYELDEPQQPSARSGFEADFSDDFLDAFADDLSSERPLDDLAASRKMSLAMTYIEQGEIQSACNILNEVIDQGDEQQKEEARELLSRIA